MNVSGGLLHAHTRDPLLAALPKEALEEMARAYDAILAKHALPVLDVSQDAPQNQIESKPAIGQGFRIGDNADTGVDKGNGNRYA